MTPQKIINTLLFIIKSLGGRTEVLRLFRLIYFADLTHLARYGMLITGDTYVAMKHGPLPFHIFLLYQKLLTNNPVIEFETNLKEYFLLEAAQISNLQEYDSSYLAKSEVECIFEIVRAYKQATMETICKDAKNIAWDGAGQFNEISVEDLAKAAQVTGDMLAYIRYSYKINEKYVTPEAPGEKGLKTKMDLSLYTINVGCVLVDNTINNSLCIVIGMSLSHFAFIEIIPSGLLSIEGFYEKLRTSFILLSEEYEFIGSSSYVDCSKILATRFGDLSIQLKQDRKTVLGKISQKDIYTLIRAVYDNYTLSLNSKEEYLLMIEQ